MKRNFCVITNVLPKGLIAPNGSTGGDLRLDKTRYRLCPRDFPHHIDGPNDYVDVRLLSKYTALDQGGTIGVVACQPYASAADGMRTQHDDHEGRVVGHAA